jgi:hypothetical protein
MVGCQNFLDQAEIEVKDVYNKTKMDKIIDDVRDYVYTRNANLRVLFSKYTDCEGQEAALLARMSLPDKRVWLSRRLYRHHHGGKLSEEDPILFVEATRDEPARVLHQVR